MHKFQKIRRNKLIKRFAFLFMALNLAIIAVTGFSYFYMSSMFERVVTEYNVSTVENVHATLATNFSAGEKWAQEISHNAEIESLSQKNNLKYPSGYLAASNLIDLIEYELGSSSALKEAYIYLSCSDTVISEQGMFDARFFYEAYAPHNGLSFDEWKRWLREQCQPFYQAATLTYETYDTDVVEYYCPFNAYTNSYYGCVVLNYDPTLLLEPFNGGVLLRSSDIQVHYLPTQASILSSGNDEINNYVYGQNIKTGKTILRSTPFGELIVIKHTSLNHNWEYIITLPADVFYARTNFFMLAIVFFLVMQIIAGALLTFLFTAKSYQPIGSLVRKLNDIASEYVEPEEEESFEKIEQIAQRVMGDRNRLNGELEDVRPVAFKGVLLQILNGNRSERDYALSYMSHFSQQFSLDGFICAKIFVEDNLGFAKNDSLAEMQLTRLVISNITEELFRDDFSLVTLDYDMCGVVLIFNIPWKDDPNDLQKPMQTIENRLKKIQSLIAERFQIYTSIGVSLPHHGLNNLYKCHLQAQTALTELPVSDVYGLNVYNEKQTTKTSYTYSLDTEIYLMNSAKISDYAKVKAILDSLTEENSAIFTSQSTAVFQCFILDLVGTLLRLCNELSVPSQVLHINVAKLLATKGSSAAMSQLYKDYEIICQWINSNKKSHNELLKDQIVEYIQQHCCDNSLSLVSVADSIGMNPTYLSAFIKEQLGETFLNYVLNLRMELATELLRTTDLSQQDIAVRIGYANSGVFLRVFKKKYGITPGTYRKQNQK